MLALVLASSCGERDNDAAIEEETSQPFVIKATIEQNAATVATKVSKVSATSFNIETQTFGEELASAEYSNNSFEIMLPAELKDAALQPVTAVTSSNMHSWISDRNANMLYIILLGYNSDELQGEFILQSNHLYNCGYYYVDRDFTIKGEKEGTSEEDALFVDMDMKKGWNTVYYKTDGYTDSISTTPFNDLTLSWEYLDYLVPQGGSAEVEYNADIKFIVKALEADFNALIIKANIFDAALTHDVENLVGYEEIANFTFRPGNAKIDALMTESYRLIRFANYTIDYIINPIVALNATQLELQGFVAESYYIRAYVYSLLLNWFGGVPLITTLSNIEEVTEPIGRSAPEEVRNQIIKDYGEAITYAAALRPEVKHGALQLIERVNLNAGMYGLSSLSEILACQPYQALMASTGLAWGKDAISPGIEVTDAYPEALRKGDCIYPVRFVETLLLKAEELAETGLLADAVKQLNSIITWRNAPYEQLPANAPYDAIRETIAGLWKSELNAEGLTSAFLKRSGAFLTRLAPYGAKEHHQLLPFPPREVENNPNITQNPGYE
jgi:hypothetical protein